jgi:hypothetical protein
MYRLLAQLPSNYGYEDGRFRLPLFCEPLEYRGEIPKEDSHGVSIGYTPTGFLIFDDQSTNFLKQKGSVEVENCVNCQS